MYSVSVIGATGYAGAELIRLLSSHPRVRIAHLASSSAAGQALSAVYPSFLSSRLPELETPDYDLLGRDSDVVFTALPHKVSAQAVPPLLAAGARVVDLSADFRYSDAAIYAQWYGAHPAPSLLSRAVYGLPELHREAICGAQLVGNPGCYTTCSILGLAPAVRAGLIDTDRIVIDAKSGVSGAGASATRDLHFCEVDENIKAYKVAAHRHTSEIEQELSLVAGKPIALSFTPHLIPVKRGILATIYCELTEPQSHADVMAVYRNFYEGEPFVTLCEDGSLPEIKHVNGSNECRIGWVVDRRLSRLILVSALDNLVKGAAGQAIHNMNLMLGLEETEGLTHRAWYL
ncbi:MAG: N-acetyl-gamma-glutamyl-phosphate reductase [Clostridiales bacterium]|nr:N-acetyl-gamma-glutamyl-phosphate reductase [Clostridiales bacterium]